MILFCFWGLSSAHAQDALTDALNNSYTKYELITVETDQLYDQLKEKNIFHEIELSIGDKNYQLELWDSGLLTDDYKTTLASGAKDESNPPLALKGNIKGDAMSNVRLTINEGFVYGFIKQNGKNLNIQPARYHDKSADSDLMVAYYDGDFIDNDHRTCGTTGHRNLKNHIKKTVENGPEKSVGDCYEVLISLAADFLMFQVYGGSTDDQVIGVLNDVEGNYDDEFADAILFDLNEVWVSDCNTCDPWTSSTDAGDLLDDFTDWAPNNLASHVVASLWTDRNFNGSTIGLAWLGTACTDFGYNVCQDINGANLLRVLQAHELGHNFDAVHDSGSGFIMSPSVSGSTSWTAQSEDDILDFIIGSNFCFSSCDAGGNPPVADFDFFIISDCTPGEVEFFDDSDDADTWFWTFEGGVPETSTEQNPIVFYDNTGIFSVELEVTNNSGSDTKVENDIIQIINSPIASFDYDLDELEITFDNLSVGSNLDYVWEFGDGNYSIDEHPAHVYDAPGTYVVELDIENECGFDIVEETIEIFDEPNALFSSDSQTACANGAIQFSDISYGNIVNRTWSFPGGTPETSTDPNPLVVYFTPGTYNVSLQVTNPEGQSLIEEVSYVTVAAAPSAGFTYSATTTSVSFSNTSVNATSYSWEFGDGLSSTEENPTHTYAAPGTYNVTLNIGNGCGSDVIQQSIVVYDQPNALFSSNGQTGCENISFQFTDMSYGNIVDRIWNFPGGTPATSTDPNPVVNYAAPGSYDVTLQVTNPAGQSTLTQSSHISISPQPTVGFSYSASNTTVSFSNTSTNAVSHFWEFGDGNSSVETSPTHTYATTGTYTVLLTSTNACGSTSESQTITTTLEPVAQFSTAQGASGCATYTIDFVDTSLGNPTSWNWTFPGGSPSTSTQQNPTVSYSNPGKFDVTLRVGNSVGSNEQTWNDYVEVLGPPSATYDFTVLGNRVDLINTTPGTSAVWEISDGASLNGNSVAHILASNGTYQVRLEVTDNCGIDVREFDIVIEAYPTSSFSSINTLTSDCAPQVVEFSSDSPLATSYLWQFPGGTPASSTEANPVVSYNTQGTFDVSLEVANQYGTDFLTESGVINVIDIPIVGFTSSSNGPTTSFNNTSTNATSFSWDFGDGNTSDLENPVHNYALPGTYVVSFTASNECGSSETSTAVIFDFALPIINAEFSVTTGCSPLEVAITDQTTNNPTSWSWEMPGGNPATSTDQNPVVSYDVPGTYTISAEIANADGSSSLEFTDIIVVNDVPSSEFETTVASETLSVVNNSIGATTYEWNFGDGQTSSDFEPEHSYTASGEYVVTLTATNDCGTVESSQTVTIIISSTTEIQVFGDWTLSPNPSTGEVNISFENKLSENLNYQLKDINGRNVQEGIFTVGTQFETLSVSENGFYLLILTKGDRIDVKKLTVID